MKSLKSVGAEVGVISQKADRRNYKISPLNGHKPVLVVIQHYHIVLPETCVLRQMLKHDNIRGAKVIELKH